MSQFGLIQHALAKEQPLIFRFVKLNTPCLDPGTGISSHLMMNYPKGLTADLLFLFKGKRQLRAEPADHRHDGQK